MTRTTNQPDKGQGKASCDEELIRTLVKSVVCLFIASTFDIGGERRPVNIQGRRHSIKVIADVMSLFLIVGCCIGIIAMASK